jgi:protease-4
MTVDLTPETPIEQEQSQKRRKRSRRGCSFYLGLLLLLAILFFVILPVCLSLFMGETVVPSFGEGIGLVRVESLIISPDETVEEILQFARNERIHALLVRIESPGGAVGASQEIYSAIRKVRQTHGKAVYASLGNTAASGGYYVASATDRIFANPGTVTGSIGVLFELANWEELVDKVGLRFEVVKSGQYKDIGSPNRTITAAEKRILQGLIDDAYEQFVEAIVETRSEPLEKAMRRLVDEKNSVLGEYAPANLTVEDYVRRIADGRLYTGRQALDLGLVDELGTLEDAVDRLAERSGLVDPKVIEPRRRASFRELLLGQIRGVLPVPGASLAQLSYRMWVD